jgi:acyl-CoA thioester hydrolase
MNAFWTQVTSPPFLYLFPLADAITTGLTGFELITVGACPKSARGATASVNPPATLDCTKRRLFMPDQTRRGLLWQCAVSTASAGRPGSILFPERVTVPSKIVKPEPPHPSFELTVGVRPADIDAQNHVNNTVYLRWVQEVATAHWETRAPSDARETIGWVVLRHEIDYKTPACLGDEVVLRTWVGKATRITFERFTEMRRASDHTLLSQARTIWVPVITGTGKPMRVPPEVRALFSA